METVLLLLAVFFGALFGSLLPVAPSAVDMYRSGRKRGLSRRHSLAYVVTD